MDIPIKAIRCMNDGFSTIIFLIIPREIFKITTVESSIFFTENIRFQKVTYIENLLIIHSTFYNQYILIKITIHLRLAIHILIHYIL